MIWFVWALRHIDYCRLFNVKSYSYIYILNIYMIWFGCVLWHINHFRLFNAKSSLFIYIKYIWCGLVRFYGISNNVGYLMPNPFYTYILDLISKYIFYTTILNKPELFFVRTQMDSPIFVKYEYFFKIFCLNRLIH